MAVWKRLKLIKHATCILEWVTHRLCCQLGNLATHASPPRKVGPDRCMCCLSVHIQLLVSFPQFLCSLLCAYGCMLTNSTVTLDFVTQINVTLGWMLVKNLYQEWAHILFSQLDVSFEVHIYLNLCTHVYVFIYLLDIECSMLFTRL